MAHGGMCATATWKSCFHRHNTASMFRELTSTARSLGPEVLGASEYTDAITADISTAITQLFMFHTEADIESVTAAIITAETTIRSQDTDMAHSQDIVAHSQDMTAHTVDTAHMAAITAHMVATTAHTAAITAHTVATTVHTAAITAHTATLHVIKKLPYSTIYTSCDA